MTFPAEAKPRRTSGFVVEQARGETRLYSARQGAVHTLNPTANLIWELCDGEHTVADIEQAIRARFEVSDDHDVRGDVINTLETFAEKGLLET